jgi:hypothetical protein
MSNPNEPKGAKNESGANLSKFDTGTWKRRIREGKTRGGVNEAPTTPRPNVRPKPQKPNASSNNGKDGGDE